MNRVIFLMVIGLGGAAILLSLGIWQVERLVWKQDVIADIDARITSAPVPLPQAPDPEVDAYLPVTVSGRFTGDTIRVLVSQKQVGPGYRLITAFETDAGRVLVDRGFVASDDKGIATPQGTVTVIGNLQWPREIDRYTPAPDLDNNIWFARNVPELAIRLDAAPLLVVTREMSVANPPVTPLPVDTSRIPNDHLQYAVTWFALAAIWLAMSLLFLRRRSGAKTES